MPQALVTIFICQNFEAFDPTVDVVQQKSYALKACDCKPFPLLSTCGFCLILLAFRYFDETLKFLENRLSAKNLILSLAPSKFSLKILKS